MKSDFEIEAKRVCSCGSTRYVVGRATDVLGRTMHPYVCVLCGSVHTHYASKAFVAGWINQGYIVPDVLMGGQRKGYGEKNRKDAEERRCEVCDAGFAQSHHWAPRHLFGDECEQWPKGWLCQACHTRWHQIVTPNMSGRKAA